MVPADSTVLDAPSRYELLHISSKTTTSSSSSSSSSHTHGHELVSNSRVSCCPLGGHDGCTAVVDAEQIAIESLVTITVTTTANQIHNVPLFKAVLILAPL